MVCWGEKLADCWAVLLVVSLGAMKVNCKVAERVALKVALTVELTGVELAERWVWPWAAKRAVLMGVLLVGTTAGH